MLRRQPQVLQPSSVSDYIPSPDIPLSLAVQPAGTPCGQGLSIQASDLCSCNSCFLGHQTWLLRSADPGPAGGRSRWLRCRRLTSAALDDLLQFLCCGSKRCNDLRLRTFVQASRQTRYGDGILRPGSLDVDRTGQFLEYAKKNATRTQFGSPGLGSGSHLTCVMFNAAAQLYRIIQGL